MKKHRNLIYLFFVFFIGFSPASSIAQKDSVDNGYYIRYPHQLLVRIFLSQKFAPLTIPSKNELELNYKTNSKLNLGAGVTYKGVTVNLSYGFNFINKDKGQGATKGLDLQVHAFPGKWAIDILGTFIKGYYLDPGDPNGMNLSTYYQRPDINRNVMGFTVFRVPNADKFSYKAAVIQNEWQKRSAGSLLYGGELYFGDIKGDSALVPGKVSNNYDMAGVNKINFFSIGPGAGYAYTLVLSHHFFATASAIASLDLNFSSEEKTATKYSKVRIIPGGIYKGAIGYNSARWSIAASITGNALYSGSAFTSKEYFVPTGNILFTITKKIGLTRHNS